MAEIISVSIQKGGVGKTTSAVNISAALARKGYRTLLIDLDPQGNASKCLGIESESNISNLVKEKPLPIFSCGPNLDLIPSGEGVNKAAIEMNSIDDKDRLLKYALQGIHLKYDFVVIDNQPSLNTLVTNSLMASDWVIVPIQSEYLAASGLADIRKKVNQLQRRGNPELEFLGIFLTRYNNRLLNKGVKEGLKEEFPELLMNTMIRENIALAEAPSAALSIFDYDSESNGAKDYEDLTNELLTRMGYGKEEL